MEMWSGSAVLNLSFLSLHTGQDHGNNSRCVSVLLGEEKMLLTCLQQKEMRGEQGLKIEEGMIEGEMDDWSERVSHKRACVRRRETCQNLASSRPHQQLLTYRSHSGQYVCVHAGMFFWTPNYLKSDIQLLATVLSQEKYNFKKKKSR